MFCSILWNFNLTSANVLLLSFGDDAGSRELQKQKANICLNNNLGSIRWFESSLGPPSLVHALVFANAELNRKTKSNQIIL